MTTKTMALGGPLQPVPASWSGAPPAAALGASLHGPHWKACLILRRWRESWQTPEIRRRSLPLQLVVLSRQEPGPVMAGVSLVHRSRRLVRQNGTICEMSVSTVPQKAHIAKLTEGWFGDFHMAFLSFSTAVRLPVQVDRGSIEGLCAARFKTATGRDCTLVEIAFAGVHAHPRAPAPDT